MKSKAPKASTESSRRRRTSRGRRIVVVPLAVRSTAPVTGDGPAIVESRKKTTKIMPQVKKQKKHSSVKMKKKEIPEIKRNTPTRSFHRYIEDGGGISDECDVGEIALSHNSQVEDI